MSHLQMSFTECTSQSQSQSKPLEIYAFIDPLCADCWELQSVIRKLQVQYEHYFTLRIVLSTKLSTLNGKKARKVINEHMNDFSHPALPSLAIKAAELQGKKAGIRFLQKLQENIFFHSKYVETFSTLLQIAEDAKLDIEEFSTDIRSEEATKAFQCDLYISREMEVQEVPSLVFFNENIEDEGLKVSGIYDYPVYEEILQQMVNEPLTPKQPPEIDELFKRFSLLSTKEIATIYGVTSYTAEKELKKRTLLQQLERLPRKGNDQWRLKI